MTDQLWAPWTGDGVTYHLLEAPGSNHGACCALFTFDAHGTLDGVPTVGPRILPDQAVPLAELPQGHLVCGVCVGISHARHETALRAAIAYEIRAELVCCRIYDELAEARRTLSDAEFDKVLTARGHGICYWGEAGARAAEGRDNEEQT